MSTPHRRRSRIQSRPGGCAFKRAGQPFGPRSCPATSRRLRQIQTDSCRSYAHAETRCQYGTITWRHYPVDESAIRDALIEHWKYSGIDEIKAHEIYHEMPSTSSRSRPNALTASTTSGRGARNNPPTLTSASDASATTKSVGRRQSHLLRRLGPECSRSAFTSSVTRKWPMSVSTSWTAVDAADSRADWLSESTQPRFDHAGRMAGCRAGGEELGVQSGLAFGVPMRPTNEPQSADGARAVVAVVRGG